MRPLPTTSPPPPPPEIYRWEFDFQVMLVPVHRSAWISGRVYAYKTDDCQKYVRACSWNDMEISRRLDVVKYRLAPLVFSPRAEYIISFFLFCGFFHRAVNAEENDYFFFFLITNWIQEWNRKNSNYFRSDLFIIVYQSMQLILISLCDRSLAV